MLCPIDGAELTVTERQGVQIDFCPLCRGVWLDRGELDKIIEAAYAVPAGVAANDAPAAPPGQDPPAIGVWADSIAPTPAAPPSYSAPQSYALDSPPIQPDPNLAPVIIPTLGGLLSGLAGQMANQGQRQPGRRKKHRGWLEEMFDIDLD